MRKILIIPLFALCLIACKKDLEIKGTRDLKNLSLSQLKKFLDGEWRWHQSVTFTIAGVDTIKSNGIYSYLIFYSTDSLKQIIENTIHVKEKIQFEYLSLPGSGGKSANVFKWGHNGLDYSNKWVADRLINDTLIFENHFHSEGIDQHFYTKEK